MRAAIEVHPGLGQRLLVAVARARLNGAEPPNWQQLSMAAGGDASPRAVNAALLHLAESGYIEGLCSREGWFDLRPTERGLKRAGRAAHQPAPAVEAPEPVEMPELAEAPTDMSADDLPAAGASTAPALARQRVASAWAQFRSWLTPQWLALRANVSQAWHLFTSFP